MAVFSTSSQQMSAFILELEIKLRESKAQILASTTHHTTREETLNPSLPQESERKQK